MYREGGIGSGKNLDHTKVARSLWHSIQTSKRPQIIYFSPEACGWGSEGLLLVHPSLTLMIDRPESRFFADAG